MSPSFTSLLINSKIQATAQRYELLTDSKTANITVTSLVSTTGLKKKHRCIVKKGWKLHFSREIDNDKIYCSD